VVLPHNIVEPKAKGSEFAVFVGDDLHFSLDPRGVKMGRVLNEILLFSCMAAFATGIVIAVASLLG
jgi:hypothetical protein